MPKKADTEQETSHFARGERSRAALGRLAPTERGLSSEKGRLLAAWLQSQPSLPREMTLQEIGSVIGLTRERVRQLLNKLGVSERKGTPRTPINEDHPGYAAYVRGLSRGASKSAARAAAIYTAKMQDPAYREQRNAGQRVRARTRYHEDPDYRARYRAKMLEYNQERREENRERGRRRYREEPDYRARALERNRRCRARKRERQATGGGGGKG